VTTAKVSAWGHRLRLFSNGDTWLACFCPNPPIPAQDQKAGPHHSLGRCQPCKYTAVMCDIVAMFTGAICILCAWQFLGFHYVIKEQSKWCAAPLTHLQW
jgi:hypothetical protein